MSYKSFVMTHLIDDALQEGNLKSARRVIANVCPFDRTFTTSKFEDALEYVRDVKGVNIFEPFDPSLKPLYAERVDRKDPTLEEDDFAVSVAYLKENFCLERIEDTKKLGRYLFPEEMHLKKKDTYGNTSSTNIKKYLSDISELLKVGYEKIKEIDRETSKAIDSGDIDSQNKLEEKRKDVSLIMKKCNYYVSIIAKEVKKSNKKTMESISSFDSDSQLECSICALLEECGIRALEPPGVCGEIVMEDAETSMLQKLKTMWKKFITNVLNFFKRMSMIIKNKISDFKIKSTSKKINSSTSVNLSKEDIEYLEKVQDEIKKIKEM